MHLQLLLNAGGSFVLDTGHLRFRGVPFTIPWQNTDIFVHSCQSVHSKMDRGTTTRVTFMAHLHFAALLIVSLTTSPSHPSVLMHPAEKGSRT